MNQIAPKAKIEYVDLITYILGALESWIELEEVDLVDGKSACVKNVSMLKAMVRAIKTLLPRINHSNFLQM